MRIKKLAFALALGALVVGASYGAYWVGMAHGMRTTAASAAPTTRKGPQKPGDIDPATGKRVLYWHDPMVRGHKFDQPGKSPFMDMELVPVYADEGGDEGKVTISPRIEQNLGIRTAVATIGKVAAAVEAVGSVAYNERDVAVVQARAAGYVEKLYVRAPLDRVEKGQALAELYAPEWVAAQEEYLAVRRMSGAGLEPLLEGARQRMRLAGMTEAQIQLVEATQSAHPRLTVSAPVAGVIGELQAREGMTVVSGTPLFRINGLATVWVNAEVPESRARLVRPGNRVEARTPALPGEVFRGHVSALLPEVQPITRTVKARVELANRHGKLVPGMFARIDFAPLGHADVVLVPSEAVIQTGTRSVVMLAEGDGKFSPVDVEIGIEANGQTEIRKGLAAGQKVVTSGQFLIDSEASLRGTATRMGER